VTNTISPIASGLAAISRAEPRCVGHISAAEGGVDYPISWSDWARDAAWAQSFLKSRGIRAGDFVVIVSTGHEAPWYGPILDAVYDLHATVCPLEPARFEAIRAEMFFKRFPITTIIGLDRELGLAIDQSIGLERVLGKMRSVLVRSDALELVTARGVAAQLIVPIGPALGLACSERLAVHVNEAEWAIADEGGATLSIAPKPQRIVAGDTIRVARTFGTLKGHRCSCKHGQVAFAPM
jgi:hypothetical protein